MAPILIILFIFGGLIIFTQGSVVTSFIFTIVTIIDGSVLTETIFSWPGMGQLILDSVLNEDIPVAMATFSFIGVFALVAHFIADISYAYLDPTIRIQSQG